MTERSAAPAPPVAKKVPKVAVVHGDVRQDDYFWLRDKDAPDVTAYLESENAYTDVVMKSTEAFQDALYREMLARIKEDDTSVPYPYSGWLYYSRTETGKQYAIHCRKRAPDAPEQVTLDLNALAEGHEFLALGAYAVSDDGRWLAYTLDYTGFRDYALHVKDLVGGAVATERVEKVSSVAWAADSATLFYVVEDDAKRPYRLHRHRLGTPVADDPLVYEETDALFRLGVWRSRSRSLLFAGSGSFTATEVRWLPADALDDD
jgi:oligopeptidase B